jgi:hypothetical protein
MMGIKATSAKSEFEAVPVANGLQPERCNGRASMPHAPRQVALRAALTAWIALNRALATPLLICVVAFVLTGCASIRREQAPAPRAFNFQTDTFSFSNELVWEYHFDEHGKWVSAPRPIKPDYHHRCFVVVRSAKQFFMNARFDPAAPKGTPGEYRQLVRGVVSSSPRRALPPEKQIVIPGYANLREFSKDHEELLKAECGRPWQSYVQRGHWRIMFPFTRRHQARTARDLLAEVRQNRPAIVHLAKFPQLIAINHAFLVFGAVPTAHGTDFLVYDPNYADAPRKLIYDQHARRFEIPQNDYFPGGRVDVYEIYNRWNY